ncbi:MAG TPA: SDR family oxidoreductase [Bryobacteraceae bacterium]|nr:SDR family oxidoreductase [Bryobacteraceae bacterium]
MDQFLEGKSAVVTGGTKGIGFAIAKALAGAGAAVAICGRGDRSVENAITQLASGSKSKVVGKAADVRSSTEVMNFFQFVDRELGGLDILVNNAGIGVFQSTAELTVDDWNKTLETNLSGAFYCSKEALPRMRNRGAGYIINISSLAGKNAFAGGAAYNASKFGLNGFSEAMMLDHRYEGVRVSCVMPGSVDTEFGKGANRGAAWKIAPDDVAEIALMLLKTPARTLISSVEVRPSKPQK